MFLDAIVIRCVMLPAVLELLGGNTRKPPRWLDRRLPHFKIEGESAHRPIELDEPDAAEELGFDRVQV